MTPIDASAVAHVIRGYIERAPRVESHATDTVVEIARGIARGIAIDCVPPGVERSEFLHACGAYPKALPNRLQPPASSLRTEQ